METDPASQLMIYRVTGRVRLFFSISNEKVIIYTLSGLLDKKEECK
jgi:hypothetical protein